MIKHSTVLVTLLLVSNLAACVQAPPATLAVPTAQEARTETPVPTTITPARQTARPSATATAAADPTDAAPVSPDLPVETPVGQASPILPTETSPPPAVVVFTATPALPCDQAAPGSPIDITVPDNTAMQPGQTFAKTWRLVNVGTCIWTQEYALVWFSGERFSAVPETSLLSPVLPGQTVDLTVDMLAPDQPGLYQSHWKLRSTSGQLFGIGPSGDAPIWVRIQVLPPTPSPAAETPTPLPTLPVYSSGTARLLPGDNLDLDLNLTSAGGNADLLYTQEPAGSFLISPQNGASFGPFSLETPGLTACQAALLSSQPVPLDGVTPGSTACVRTSLGLPGWVRILQIDGATGELQLELLTWATP